MQRAALVRPDIIHRSPGGLILPSSATLASTVATTAAVLSSERMTHRQLLKELIRIRRTWQTRVVDPSELVRVLRYSKLNMVGSSRMNMAVNEAFRLSGCEVIDGSEYMDRALAWELGQGSRDLERVLEEWEYFVDVGMNWADYVSDQVEHVSPVPLARLRAEGEVAQVDSIRSMRRRLAQGRYDSMLARRALDNLIIYARTVAVLCPLRWNLMLDPRLPEILP